MDDYAFQQQLHELKGRVNTLTMQYSPKPAAAVPTTPRSPPPSSEDHFAEQMRDVKAHLDRLQTLVAKCEASMRHTSLPHQPELASKAIPAGWSVALPCDERFDALYSYLKSNFDGINTRMNSLEMSVNDMQDTVDGLDPDRFTPASSTASHKENEGVQLSQKPNPDLHDGFDFDAWLCSGEGDSPGLAQGSPPVLGKDLEKPQTRGNERLHGQQGNISMWHAEDYGKEVGTPHSKPVPVLYSCPSELADPASDPLLMPEGGIPKEAAAFRDREIARMDEQLRVKDSAICDMQAEIEALRSERADMDKQISDDFQAREGCEGRIRDLTKDLQKCGDACRKHDERQKKWLQGHIEAINLRNRALQYWRERCNQEASMFQQTIAERDQALQRWEESYNAASDAWRQDTARCSSLESMLDRSQDERRLEIDQLHKNYEREMEKLKEFCGHKDAVIVKQEHVISRGANLMQDRDAEIDRLQRRLRAAEDDKLHDSRQQKRLARLLDETRAELELVKRGNGSAPVRDSNGIVSFEDTPDMIASTEAVDGHQPVWETNRRFDAERTRSDYLFDPPHDDRQQSRASMNDGRRRGSLQGRRPHRQESSRHQPLYGSTRQKHVRRPSSPYPRPHCRAGDDQPERPLARENEPESRPPLPDRPRQARFDDATFDNPPIPAAAMARKMASEADLRARNDVVSGGAERSLAKQQSMQELPRRRGQLQAYVETDGESDGEIEGRDRG